MTALLAGLFFITVSALYILSYYFNQKTPTPEGVLMPESEKCGSCSNISCGAHQKINKGVK